MSENQTQRERVKALEELVAELREDLDELGQAHNQLCETLQNLIRKTPVPDGQARILLP